MGNCDLRVLLKWKHNREFYPGWIVPPERNRKSLWRNVERWIEPIFDWTEEANPKISLVLLYELIWRFDKVGRPLSTDEMDQIESALTIFNPFSEEEQPEESESLSIAAGGGESEWEVRPSHLRKAWIELAFSVVRTARKRLGRFTSRPLTFKKSPSYHEPEIGRAHV